MINASPKQARATAMIARLVRKWAVRAVFYLIALIGFGIWVIVAYDMLLIRAAAGAWIAVWLLQLFDVVRTLGVLAAYDNGRDQS